LRFAFKELPGRERDLLRPVVPVIVEGIPRAPQLCLVDTGSLHNRFARWVATAAGIDLSTAPEEVLKLGGFTTSARTATVQLSLGDTTWEAPVSFCEPWPLSFHLLGQEGFFRWFKVGIRAATFTLEVEPEDR
jgi:hypothetical protein